MPKALWFALVLVAGIAALVVIDNAFTGGQVMADAMKAVRHFTE